MLKVRDLFVHRFRLFDQQFLVLGVPEDRHNRIFQEIPELQYYFKDYLFFHNIHSSQGKFLYSTYITKYTSAHDLLETHAPVTSSSVPARYSSKKKAMVGYDFNILSWWKEYAYQFPHLSIMTKHYLSIPVSSKILNHITGNDWFEDFWQEMHEGKRAFHRSPFYEMLSNSLHFSDMSSSESGNNGNIQSPLHSSSTCELLTIMLLGHNWTHLVQRNHWK